MAIKILEDVTKTLVLCHNLKPDLLTTAYYAGHTVPLCRHSTQQEVKPHVGGSLMCPNTEVAFERTTVFVASHWFHLAKISLD